MTDDAHTLWFQDPARIGTGQALLVQKRNGIGAEYLILKRRS